LGCVCDGGGVLRDMFWNWSCLASIPPIVLKAGQAEQTCLRFSLQSCFGKPGASCSSCQGNQQCRKRSQKKSLESLDWPSGVKELRGGLEVTMREGCYTRAIVPSVICEGFVALPRAWPAPTQSMPSVCLLHQGSMQEPLLVLYPLLTLGCLQFLFHFLSFSAGIPYLLLSHTWEHQHEKTEKTKIK
jgi:hypothetical protein